MSKFTLIQNILALGIPHANARHEASTGKKRIPMKSLSMALILIPALCWLLGIKIEAAPQGSPPQKSKVAGGEKTSAEEKAKIPDSSPHQTKDDPAPLANEDCGCETSLFGEAVNPAEKKPAKEDSEKTKKRQELKAKDASEVKAGAKSEKKEGTQEKQGKPQTTSTDTNRPK
jgi:hypothetical protein